MSIGSGVTEIPYYGFYDNDWLTHITVPDNVTNLGIRAFAGCSKLKCIEIGIGLKRLYYESFTGIYSYDSNVALDTIIIRATTPPATDSYSLSSFQDALCSRALLFVPDGAVETYKSNANWGKFAHIYKEGEEVVLHTITVHNSDRYAEYDCGAVYIDGNKINDGNLLSIEAGKSFELECRPTPYMRYMAPSTITLGEQTITLDSDNKATVKPTESADLTVHFAQTRLPYDFTEVVPSGQTLYFTVTDEANKKVKIVNQSGGRSISGNVTNGYSQENYKPSGDLVIPSSITHEGENYTITEIDTLAFYSCYKITSLTIQEGVEIIRGGAFDYCTGLKGTLFLPQSCTAIEMNAFRDCTGITEVDLGGLKNLALYVFLYCPITKISGPNIEVTEQRAFQLTQLTEIELGENLTFVSNSSFADCPKLQSVTLYATTPPAVRLYESYAYPSTSWSYFSNIGSVTLYVPYSEDHSVLEAYKAAECWKLFGTIEEMPAKYTITTSVAAGSEGWGNVSGAGKYEANASVTLKAVPVVHYRFKEWQDGNTDNPRTITVTGDATYTASFEPIPTAVGDTLVQYMDGYPIYAKVTSVSPNEVKLIQNNSWFSAFTGSFTTPQTFTDYWGAVFTTTAIDKNALYGNTRITELTVSEGVKTINQYAISGLGNMTTLTLPATLETMDVLSVNNNNNLETLHFAGTENLKTIPSRAFNSCKFITEAADGWIVVDGVALGYKGTAPEFLSVPEEVTFIADLNSYPSHNFNNTKTLRLPHNLRAITMGAFMDMMYRVTTVQSFARTAPTVDGSSTKPFGGYEETYVRLQVSCEADADSYTNDSYWNSYKEVSTNMNLYRISFNYNVSGAVVGDFNSNGGCNEMRLGYTIYNPAYEFDSWWDDSTDAQKIITLTQDTTLQINVKKKQFEVVFVDEFGTEIKRQTYEYGDMPSCDDPTKEADETYTYTFDSWDKTFVEVTEATTYTASYTKTYIDYTIRFVNDDDAATVLDEQTLHYGDVITYAGVAPTKDETAQFKYTFKGWSDGFEDGVTTVTGNITYTAQYTATTQKYVVTFLKEEGGEEIKHVTVAYGANATAAAPAEESLTPPSADKRFAGWSGDITFIVGTTTVWPTWRDKIYTVIFYDPIADAEIDRFENVAHGEEVLPPAAPAHEGYVFKGWDSDAYKNVTDDLLINAVYESTATALDGIEEAPATARKVLIDGRLYILTPDGRTYNALGAEVK